MKNTRFTEEQKAFALRQADSYRAWDDIKKMVLEVDKHWYTYPYQDGFAT